MSEIKWTPLRKIEIFNNEKFWEISSSKLVQNFFLNKIQMGDIIIFKKIIPKLEIDKIILSIKSYDYETTDNPKITEGVKNLKYQSNNILENISESGKYAAVDNSYYFFPWNVDDLRLFERFQDIFDVVIKINGHDPSVVKNNTPINRIVERFHLIHYPLNSGEISLHIDPTNIIKVNSGIYFSEYGIDYSEGGFFVLNSNKIEVNVDEKVGKGDLILFSPNLAHGVKRIFSNNDQGILNSGRFFFHMSLVESHEFPDRQKSIGLEIKAL